MGSTRWILLLALALVARGQTVVNPERLPARWKDFDAGSGESRLQCRIQPVQPSLNLGFHFQTGYAVEVPMKQYSGPGHWWSVVLKVTPELSEREPVWLTSRVRIPPVLNTKAIGEMSGGYIIGEGKYRVDMLLVDDRDRSCSRSWTVKAKLSDQVREIRPGLPPGAVDDFSMRRWRTANRGPAERPFRISILMHAAPAFPNRVRLREYDRGLLMSALGSMAERLPASIRLSIFSMDRQKEIFRTADLTGESWRSAAEALDDLELGTIDYTTLQNRTGHIDLVSTLLNREAGTREAGTKDQPDVVIVLGPVARSGDRIPDQALETLLGNVPVYYIQLRPWRLARNIWPDTITHAVRRVGGKTKIVYSPDDFASAIREIDQILKSRVGSTSSRNP